MNSEQKGKREAERLKVSNKDLRIKGFQDYRIRRKAISLNHDHLYHPRSIHYNKDSGLEGLGCSMLSELDLYAFRDRKRPRLRGDGVASRRSERICISKGLPASGQSRRGRLESRIVKHEDQR